jgi:hypothetical protein
VAWSLDATPARLHLGGALGTLLGMATAKSGSLPLALFGLVFLAAGLFFILTSLQLARDQAHKLAAALPVPATVVGSQVVSHRGSKSTSHRPLVTFRYQVDGRERQAETVFPLAATFSDEAPAQAVVARHPPGSQTTAWYDPAAPDAAFLERRVDFMPYLGILFPLLHASVGLSLLLFSLRPPGEDTRSGFRRMTVVFVAGMLVVVLSTAHFFSIGGVLDGPSGGILGGAWTVALLLGWWWSRTCARIVSAAVPIAPES